MQLMMVLKRWFVMIHATVLKQSENVLSLMYSYLYMNQSFMIIIGLRSANSDACNIKALIFFSFLTLCSVTFWI